MTTPSDETDQSTGTLTSFLRCALRWPQAAGRALCGTPGRLSSWLAGAAGEAGLGVWRRWEDFLFLFELLSLGLPLLCMLLEVLAQIYSEAPSPPQPGLGTALALQDFR